MNISNLKLLRDVVLFSRYVYVITLCLTFTSPGFLSALQTKSLALCQIENASQVDQTPDLTLLSTTSLQHRTNNINLARDLSEIELTLSTDTRNGSH
jgi:hypothetical protein